MRQATLSQILVVFPDSPFQQHRSLSLIDSRLPQCGHGLDVRLPAAEDLQEDGLELVAEGAVDQDVDGGVDRHEEVGHLEGPTQTLKKSCGASQAPRQPSLVKHPL